MPPFFQALQLQKNWKLISSANPMLWYGGVNPQQKNILPYASVVLPTRESKEANFTVLSSFLKLQSMKMDMFDESSTKPGLN